MPRCRRKRQHGRLNPAELPATTFLIKSRRPQNDNMTQVSHSPSLGWLSPQTAEAFKRHFQMPATLLSAGPSPEFMARVAEVPTATARDEHNGARTSFVPRRDQLVALW